MSMETWERIVNLYINYDDKKSAMRNAYQNVLENLCNCEYRDGPIEWEWDHTDMDWLIESVAIFFETHSCIGFPFGLSSQFFDE